MVNCISCQKAFRSRIGKTSKTRCESCAAVWRDKQLLEEENERLRQAKDIEFKIRDLDIRERQLELERQKVTIKETSIVNGNTIELTCYYDRNARDKIQELLSGARRSLPKPPKTEPIIPQLMARRRQYLTDISGDDDDNDRLVSRKKQLELRRPRRLPSIDSSFNTTSTTNSMTNDRVKARYRLEDEFSSSVANSTGLSVD